MMVVSVLLRFAASVFCMLTAVLLIGGGAVAVADPDSSGSSAAHGKSGDNASGQHGKGNNASGPHGNGGNQASGQRGNDNNASSGKGKGGNQASGRPSTRAQSPQEA